MSRVLTYTEAIKEATDQCMGRDEKVFVMGLGVTYPNGADGTTKGLAAKYPTRVWDMPCSENASTGLCLGAALTGMRPLLVHGRVEFAMFGFDQIVTQAAKWNYMFGGDWQVPLVIRAAVGRQWGNGPQHTQALHSVFGHIPGLKAVIPSTPSSAKGLLAAAVLDNSPVLFLEHRWLYGISESVPTDFYSQALDRCHVIKPGKDVTIVGTADTLLDALHCLPVLAEHGIDAEIIDLVSVNPIDYEGIFRSVQKTRRLIVADVGTKACGIGSELTSSVCEEMMPSLLAAPVNIGAPHCPLPTTPALAEYYYPRVEHIIAAVGKLFKIKIAVQHCTDFQELHMPPRCNVDSLLSDFPTPAYGGIRQTGDEVVI